MRKLLFISLVFFATLKLHSQNYTFIPDAAFEQALINQGYDDVLDGRILTSSAEAVTRLEMSNQNPKITDITGIEAFTNLEYFEAIDNSIVVLDFTKNTNLQEIRCWHNSSSDRTVEMLDVTGLTALTYVGLDNNLIRVADFSTNSALQIVGIQNNELTSLKFHPNADLEFLRFGDNSLITHVDISSNDTNINTFRAVNNPNLTCIQVSNLTNAQTNPNWEEDNIGNYSTTTCAEAAFTLIPDVGFEQFLIDNSWDSGVPDGRVLTSNLNFQGRFNGFNITDGSYNINELTGIQDFTDDIEGIDIQNQPLSITPYLGPNPNLNLIIFQNNPNLNDVSFLPFSNLTNITLTGNGLDSFSVTEFPQLTSLQVWENLSFLDVTQNVNLDSLSLNNNNISEIDVLPLSSLTTLSLYGNNIGDIDLSQNTNLISLTLGENNLTELDISNNLSLELLDIGYNSISLIDVRPHSSLEFLDLEFNNFSTIDVTQNPLLTHLLLTNNSISTIDISQNSNLEVLELDENNLTEIDLSQQTNLFLFYINDNQISELNISNSFVEEAPGVFTFFNAQNNPNLSCIQVDNVTDAQNNTNWTKDPTTTYSLNCGNQPFTVTTSIGGDVVDTDPEACCTAYEITEGGLLEIYFEADAIATLGEEYIVQLSLSGSVATEADISNRENSPTLQYTYSVKAGNPDNTMQIDILNDGIEELGGENLKLTFTAVGSNYSFTGTTVYDITINDQPTTPYTVAANLTNAGSLPNYTVTEGQTFNLNLNADATAQNGTVYNPIITVTRNGVDATADFSISGLNQPITVNNGVNPDGSIQFTANDDGNDTGDQVYTITVASENTANYTIQTPETFVVTVKDSVITTNTINVTLDNVQLENGSFFIPEGRGFFEIQIDVPNALDGLEFSSSIDFSQSVFIEEDLSFQETDFTVTTSSSNIDYQNQISFFLDDNVSELNDKIILVLSKPDNENFVWADANQDGEAIFEIAVIDDIEFSTTPVDVVFNSTNLTLLPPDIGFIAEPSRDNFSFPENSTENILISFVTDNQFDNPISEYQLRIQTSNFSAEEGADFVGINEIRTFLANDNNEHVIEIEILDDQFLEVDDFGNSETFDLNISSITPGVRIKSINGVLLEEDVDYSLNIEIIDDDNISEPFEVDVQLNGNFSNENGNLSIVEGENFEITFNAESPAAENYIYTVQYDTEGSTAFDETNYTLPNSPVDIRVQNTFFSEPGNPIDAQINFEVLTDLEEEVEELLVINFRPDTENVYTWKGANENGILTFTINVLENEETNNQIIAKFSSTGGIEGGTDTYKIELLDQQGNPFVNTSQEDIEFQLFFTNERDSDILLEIAQGDIGVPADEGSYIAQNSDSLDNAKIVIEPNQSNGTFVVNYPPDGDTEREFYTVEIEPLENQEAFVLQPSKIQSIILDEQGPYYAAIFPKPDGDLKLLPNDGEFNQSCCAGFSVEENSIIEFYVDVEKGVPATENANNPSFEIGFSFLGDAEISTSTELKDFSKRDDNDVLEIIVNPSEPRFDNRLLLDIWDDGIPNERVKLDDDGNPVITSIGEQLTVNFTSQSNNLILKNPIFGDVYTFQSFGALPTSFYDIRIIDVLSVASFESLEGKSVALEEGETTAEFEIVLSEENVSGNDIIINYEILQNQSNSANPLNDFLVLDADLNLNTFRGQTVVLPGDNTAKIILKAEDDTRFEVDEFVTIRLLPGNGYSIGEGFTSQITIISNDSASYEANLDEIKNSTSEIDGPEDYAQVQFQLDTAPITDITIEFSASVQNPSTTTEGPTIDDDFVILNSEGEILEGDIKTIVIPEGLQTVDIFIRANNDDDLESTERVFIDIENGTNYSIGANNRATIDLISDEIDGSSFDPTTIIVEARSPICAGDNQKGSIYIKNNSGFEFEVRFKSIDESNFSQPIVLDKNSVTNENFIEIPALDIGKYEVVLAFTENNDATPENIILPSYVISINKLPPIQSANQQMNFDSQTLQLDISGSEIYEVINNGQIFKFKFEDTSKQTIEIPLENGINSIEIRGEADCLGILKTDVVFNKLMAFPNPTNGKLLLTGLSIGSSHQIILTDMNSRVIYDLELKNASNSTELNLEELPVGIYALSIISSESKSNLKIIKK